GVAVLHLHALNPYGFSWLRRVTQENVDLNRNFHDFGGPLPANPAYDEIAPLLLPATWPPPDAVNARLMQFVAQRGLQWMQAAVAAGQYDHPEGLFYGGRNPTWSHQTLRHVLQDHGRACQRLAWIDLHTGLGPAGVGERIYAGRNDPPAIARARAWWGAEVTSIYDGSASAAPVTGMMALAAHDECTQAEYTGIALEFGTVPLLAVIDALRADQWLELHPEAEPALGARIKQQVRDAFYIDDEAWKRQVLAQSFEAARQAVEGLAGRR
ncbi:MAG TPA: M14 family metallopeptidase, partial [Albitalea sp.]